MGLFVMINKLKNIQIALSILGTATFAQWRMLLSPTILPSLVIIGKRMVEISTKSHFILKLVPQFCSFFKDGFTRQNKLKYVW